MVKKRKTKNQSYLVPMWVYILTIFEKLSLFALIGFLLPKLRRKYSFVDSWVIGNLLLSIISLYLVYFQIVPHFLSYCLMIYGFIRVFEIFIYQLNVLLVHPFRKENPTSYTLVGYRRMTIALVHNFFEIIFWFATTYVVFQFSFDTSLENLNPFILIYFSFLTMVSYTSNLDNTSWTLLATIVLHFQALIGLFMTLLSLARFISLLPRPGTLDISEQEQDMKEHIIRIEQKLEEMSRQMIK